MQPLPIAEPCWPQTQKSKRKALSAMDGLLAATAIHHILTIVSRNVGNFTNTQVPVVNPWEP